MLTRFPETGALSLVDLILLLIPKTLWLSTQYKTVTYPHFFLITITLVQNWALEGLSLTNQDGKGEEKFEGVLNGILSQY